MGVHHRRSRDADLLLHRGEVERGEVHIRDPGPRADDWWGADFVGVRQCDDGGCIMRIGLIAMSGVRVQDPELLALGLTLPGFVERSEVIASLPSLGLLTLAALTPDDIKVSYHEVDDLERDRVPDLGFDLV